MVLYCIILLYYFIVFKFYINLFNVGNKNFFSNTGIEIAVGHQTLSNKKGYMSGTHISNPDILSCTLSLYVIRGKSFKLKPV